MDDDMREVVAEVEAEVVEAQVALAKLVGVPAADAIDGLIVARTVQLIMFAQQIEDEEIAKVLGGA